MCTQAAATDPRWTLMVPPGALLLLALTWGRDPGVLLALAIGAALVATVVTAVHHAEILALKVGEPFGTLILAVAVTVIEVGLIITLMVSGGDGTASLARDTVFAAIMITCNLVIGLSLVVGAARHRVQAFRIEGTTGALATVTALVTLSLVLPRFTSTTSGPTFSGPQLAFAGAASLVLYAVFVFVQTVRHRDYFLPPDTDGDDEHAAPPSDRMALSSLGLLVAALAAVVGLAKTASPAIEDGFVRPGRRSPSSVW